MENDSPDLPPSNVLSRKDVEYIIATDHEYRMCSSHLKTTQEQIKEVEKEVEVLRLQQKWCHDVKGKRSVESEEDQSLAISREIARHPQLREEIVKALRMKKLDLQANLTTLQHKCDDLTS